VLLVACLAVLASTLAPAAAATPPSIVAPPAGTVDARGPVDAPVPGQSAAIVSIPTPAGPSSTATVVEARLVATPNPAVPGEPVTLDATGSVLPPEREAICLWDLDDDGVDQPSEYVYLGGDCVLERTFEAGSYDLGVRVVTGEASAPGDAARVTLDVRENERPTARIAVDPVAPIVGETITFDGRASTDPDGELVAYRWTIDGRVEATGPVVSWTPVVPGEYVAELVVEDDRGAVAVATATVPVSPTPERPVAAFVATPDVASVGDPIGFDATGSFDPDGAVVAYAWRFGDGATGEGVAPTHSYAEPGEYAVTLRVTDDDGLVGSTTSTVSIDDPTDRPPEPAFAFAPAAPVAGSPVRFDASNSTDPDGEVVAYAWTFGDGATGEGVAPTHVYADPGEYLVTLRVIDDAATSAETTRTVVVVPPPNAPPGAAFELATPAPTAGNATAFDASSSTDPDGEVVAYAWTFGDGATGEGVAPKHVYADPGEYLVTLRVTDDDGATASAVRTVAVVAPPPANEGPTVSFVIVPDDPRVGQTVAFDASASVDPDGRVVAYAWAFGDGAAGEGVAPTHAYADPGDYVVTLTVTDEDGATTVANRTVAVVAAAASGGGSSGGGSGGGGDGGSSSRGGGGGGSTAGGAPTGNEPPTAALALPDGARVGEATTLDASNATDPDGRVVRYEWDLDYDAVAGFEPTVVTDEPLVDHGFATAGTVRVALRVTDDGGARDRAVGELAVLAPPVAALAVEGANATAAGEPTTVGAVAFAPIAFDATNSTDPDGTVVSYAWTFGDGRTLTAADAGAVAHAFVAPGTYDVTATATDDDGLVGTETVRMAVAEATAACRLEPVRVAPGEPVLVDASTVVAAIAPAEEVPSGTGSVRTATASTPPVGVDADGDGVPETAANASGIATVSYGSAGAFPVTLAVTTADGRTASVDCGTVDVDVDASGSPGTSGTAGDDGATARGTGLPGVDDGGPAPPTASFTAPTVAWVLTAGDVRLDASASIPGAGADGVVVYRWDFDGDGTVDAAAPGDTPVTTRRLGVGVHRVGLEVEDAAGGVASATGLVLVVPWPIVVVPLALPAGLLLARSRRRDPDGGRARDASTPPTRGRPEVAEAIGTLRAPSGVTGYQAGTVVLPTGSGTVPVRDVGFEPTLVLLSAAWTVPSAAPAAGTGPSGAAATATAWSHGAVQGTPAGTLVQHATSVAVDGRTRRASSRVVDDAALVLAVDGTGPEPRPGPGPGSGPDDARERVVVRVSETTPDGFELAVTREGTGTGTAAGESASDGESAASGDESGVSTTGAAGELVVLYRAFRTRRPDDVAVGVLAVPDEPGRERIRPGRGEGAIAPRRPVDAFTLLACAPGTAEIGAPEAASFSLGEAVRPRAERRHSDRDRDDRDRDRSRDRSRPIQSSDDGHETGVADATGEAASDGRARSRSGVETSVRIERGSGPGDEPAQQVVGCAVEAFPTGRVAVARTADRAVAPPSLLPVRPAADRRALAREADRRRIAARVAGFGRGGSVDLDWTAVGPARPHAGAVERTENDLASGRRHWRAVYAAVHAGRDATPVLGSVALPGPGESRSVALGFEPGFVEFVACGHATADGERVGPGAPAGFGLSYGVAVRRDDGVVGHVIDGAADDGDASIPDAETACARRARNVVASVPSLSDPGSGTDGARTVVAVTGITRDGFEVIGSSTGPSCSPPDAGRRVQFRAWPRLSRPRQ
jgi:PKD repeat protein